MKKNLFLLFFSILIPFIFLELILFYFGKYQNLTKHNLSPSEAIYERSHSSIHYYKHPDLNYIIKNYYDQDGVKNNQKKITSEKKNIIGFFGDSFTENVGVNKDFEYSNILNNHLKNYNIVNYGVGGYSADQVFIRFLKYKQHDIKYIFYLIMPGDEVFSTKSIFTENGDYYIDKPNLNLFFRFIGKLNSTYFFLEGYYKIKSLLNASYSKINVENFNSILSNKIYHKFYHKSLDNCENQASENKNKKHFNCKKKLLNLLKIFNKEAELNNAKFFVLVYPDSNFISSFEKIISMEENNISYFILDKNLAYNEKLIFKNPTDFHWNEYGNIFYAKNISKIFSQINLSNKKIDFIDYLKKVDLFYENYE